MRTQRTQTRGERASPLFMFRGIVSGCGVLMLFLATASCVGAFFGTSLPLPSPVPGPAMQTHNVRSPFSEVTTTLPRHATSSPFERSAGYQITALLDPVPGELRCRPTRVECDARN
eukprot:2561159-Rhodomonas_salina.4